MDTKATKRLDEQGISYERLRHSEPALTCEKAAEERKRPLGEMVKCILVVDKKRRYYLACTLADARLDTKKLAAVLECSRLSFADEGEIEGVLGYKQGAISPLRVNIPVVFDKKIRDKEKVNISSGEPTLGLELSAGDLISLVNPLIWEIT